MGDKRVRGLFLTGTDTDVGKTYVGALIARRLRAAGHRVGVYKPAASGCRRQQDRLVSDDALCLWEAAGRPGTLDEVCPQRFAAPLAPHLAARAEGRRLDGQQLRHGLDPWLQRSDIVLVEGAGGLLSPLGADEFVADLACDLGYPLVVVARNALGTINQTLQTLFVASRYRGGLAVAGVVLNHPLPPSAGDLSVPSNRQELSARAGCPILDEVAWQAAALSPAVDWFALAR
jgi:dethiobiotin synthetase